jgi:KaiC/GvpD/RAD55 family RecA-like ATPase
MPSRSKTQRSEIFPGSSRLIHDEIDCGLILLAGPPGVGKTIFCKESVFRSLVDGNSVVYLATEESPDWILDSMGKFGWNVFNYIQNNKLRIIDAFSYRGNIRSESKYQIDNPENLTDVSVTIERARKGISNLRFVMDSITSLILPAIFGSEQKFIPGLNFIQGVTARLRGARATGICVLDAGILDEKFLNFLRFVFDGVIEMRMTEAEGWMKREMRVYSLRLGRHDNSWHEFQVTNDGIKIL